MQSKEPNLVEYPMAWDPARDVMVDVADAMRGRSGLQCPDPQCGSEMVAAQGKKNVWHFRHAKYACNGYLHYTIVNLLADRLRESLEETTPVQLRYTCETCRQVHNLNVFTWPGGAVDEVKKERQSIEGSGVRPDITLCANDGNPLALVEIVDTHYPEPEVLAQGFPVVIVNASYPLLHSLRDNKIASPFEAKVVHNVACGKRTGTTPVHQVGPVTLVLRGDKVYRVNTATGEILWSG